MFRTIFMPVCLQVMLTLIVWIWLYVTRLGTMYRKKINPQLLANEAQAQALLKDVVNPSDNFENLFEIPVLFYMGATAIAFTGLADELYMKLLWGFVIFRALHSLIHCTYNKITHRFVMYAVSSIMVWIIWGRLTWQLFS